jgi:hypothetical protein
LCEPTAPRCEPARGGDTLHALESAPSPSRGDTIHWDDQQGMWGARAACARGSS